jgi:predicted DNA binding protein
MSVSEDRITITCIGANETLARFITLMKEHVGSVHNMTLKKAVYGKQEILSVLTGKQKEVLAAAYKNGYYDYPRRITSRRLSENVRISKPTLVQHLRKAECRILAEIMAGYSG